MPPLLAIIRRTLGAAALFFVASVALGASPAGTWRFTVAGDDAGEGQAQVAPDGAISGRGSSQLVPMGLAVQGTLNPNGDITFVAAPEGMADTGSRFTGRVEGDTAIGTWTNPALGLSGTWTAVRAANDTVMDGAECRIGERRFRAAIVQSSYGYRSDGGLLRSGHRSLFRLLASAPEGNAGNDETDMVDLKGVDIPGPGTWPLHDGPLWRSTVTPGGGEDRHTSQGEWRITTLRIDGGPRVAGTVVFQAPGAEGECRFDVPLIANNGSP
jgi:hypothetical protein